MRTLRLDAPLQRIKSFFCKLATMCQVLMELCLVPRGHTKKVDLVSFADAQKVCEYTNLSL